MRILFVFIIAVLVSCEQKKVQDQNHVPVVVLSTSASKPDPLQQFYVNPGVSYSQSKSECINDREHLREKYLATADEDARLEILREAGKALTNDLLYKIFPHWYGTAWDFDGYTSVPPKGVIACGYFVSTTLLDAGVSLNRYKLAQQAPIDEALSIQGSDSLFVVSNLDDNSVVDFFEKEKLDDGLYFVGLDYHVGYLFKQNKNLFFIHSNYVERKGVQVEIASESPAFLATMSYRIAQITHNHKLVRSWLLGNKIQIVQSQQ